MNHFLSFIKNDRGATMVEYALLVALITVIALGVIKNLGQSVSTTFTTLSNALTPAP